MSHALPPNGRVPNLEPPREMSPIGLFIGSLIVDACVQFALSHWFAWIVKSFTGVQINTIFFWIGMTALYTGIYRCNKDMSGRLIVLQVFLLIISSLFIVIFR